MRRAGAGVIIICPLLICF